MTHSLWNSQDFLSALGTATSQNLTSSPITGISFDTRTLQPGDAFFAISWDATNDSHRFVPQAVAAGAALCVVSRREPGWEDYPLALVPDTVQALEHLGQAGRNRTQARIVAVTGSVGKTSTKDMLNLVLSRQGPTYANPKSYNNLWGVPYSLASLPPTARFGVFEIGMNHAGEITPLTRQVRPQVAIITTVCAAHLEFFKSVDDIALAKSEIFAGMTPGGVAILNRDNPYFMTLCHRARDHRLDILSFGANDRSDIRLLSYDFATGRVVCEFEKQIYDYTLNIPGHHQALNSLAVLGAVHALSGDKVQAALDMGSYEGTPRRGTQETLVVNGKKILLIDESYNANPGSVAAALDNLAAMVGSRKIAVLGEMRELGPLGPELHADLKAHIVPTDIARVHTCYPLMHHLHQALPATQRGIHGDNAASLLDAILADLKDGDVIMVKGSLSTHMALITQGLRQQATPTTDNRSCLN